MALRNLEAGEAGEPALSHVAQLFGRSWKEEDCVFADDALPPGRSTGQLADST